MVCMTKVPAETEGNEKGTEHQLGEVPLNWVRGGLGTIVGNSEHGNVGEEGQEHDQGHRDGLVKNELGEGEVDANWSEMAIRYSA